MKKTMKKSMLVTTVLMVLLLIVALSTATFAWYTAQTTASVTTTVVSSARSEAASLALDWDGTKFNSTSSKVTLTMSAGALNPMVPIAKPTADTTLTGMTFNSGTVNNDGVFISTDSANPATVTEVYNADGNANTTASTSFYAINTDSNNAITTLYASITINTAGYIKCKDDEITADNFAAQKTSLFTKTDSNANGATYTALAEDATFDTTGATKYYKSNANIYKYLRVALFVKDGDNFKYVDTWGGIAETYYGTITEGAASSTLKHEGGDAYSAKASGAKAQLGSVAALAAKQMTVIAWFDGNGLTAVDSGAEASFTIAFSTTES